MVDDEQKARETIIQMLNLYCTDIEIAGEAENVENAYLLLKNIQPDLVLLDIQMPDGTGFDLLKKFNNLDFKIVFITAYKEHAIKAFKYSALDYLLKPIDPDDLTATIDRVKKTLEESHTSLKFETLLENITLKNAENRKIVLRTSESIHLVKISDIIRCESSSNYTQFYLADGKKLLVSKTLKEYDEMLTNDQFFRTHQSHLVNLNYIDRFDKTEGGYLVMKDGSHVPVSFRKKDQLLKLFNQI